MCPADRPDRFRKAADAADGVILDLEDGVGPANKAMARESVAAAVARLPADRTVVRINPPHTEAGRADVDVVLSRSVRTVILPKAEDPEVVASLSPLRVVGLCETAAGVLAAAAMAQVDNCVALI